MGIYKITNTINDKVYIGQSVQLSKRLYDHRIMLKNNYHNNQHLQNAYNKHGDVFKIEVIEYCNDKSQLDDLEQHYISCYDATNPEKGYNKVNGGNCANKKGKNHPMFGKHHSKETKKKLSAANKGQISWTKGRPLSEQHRKRISEAKNTTGFYRVTKYNDNKLKQGFTWCYQYYLDNKTKRIVATNLNKLQKKVKSKNLLWKIIDEEKAKQSLELNNKYHKGEKND